MRKLQLGLGIAGVVALTSGCDVLDDIDDRAATVQVHVTHHATPADGVFPNLGDEGQARVFDNDAGWRITLEEAFVVTADATLVACDGAVHELGLYWGPVPENISDTDLDLFSFGGVDVPPGEYCSVIVQYGPYVPIDERTASQYEMPEDEDALLGATAYLRGFAVQGEALVTFEARADAIVEVELDLRDELGEPLHVDGEEAFPVELTLSKTYDRFFDGVDFATLADGVLAQTMTDVLGAETRVSSGTRVDPD